MNPARRNAVVMLAAATVFGGPALAAQSSVPVGTAIFNMKMPTPSASASPLGAGHLEVEMTWATDGRQVAMNMLMNGPDMLIGMSTRVIFTLGGDTVHVGIIMPPALSNGMPGTRMDIPIPMIGATNPIMGQVLDSLSKVAPNATYRALGTFAVVAGISCAEWEMVSGSDTTRTCVIPTPPGLAALTDQINRMSGMQALMKSLPGMADLQQKAYNGQALTAIRTVNTRTGMTQELVKFVAGAPDPSMFQLPAGLQVMAPPGGGGTR